MNKDIEIFLSLWNAIEPFFIEKEKQYAAVLYVSVFAEYLELDETMCKKCNTDHYLSDALKDWFNINEDNNDG